MVAVQVVSVNFVLPSQGLLFCPHNVLLVVIVLGSCLSLAALTDTETAVILTQQRYTITMNVMVVIALVL